MESYYISIESQTTWKKSRAEVVMNFMRKTRQKICHGTIKQLSLTVQEEKAKLVAKKNFSLVNKNISIKPNPKNSTTSQPTILLLKLSNNSEQTETSRNITNETLYLFHTNRNIARLAFAKCSPKKRIKNSKVLPSTRPGQVTLPASPSPGRGRLPCEINSP